MEWLLADGNRGGVPIVIARMRPALLALTLGSAAVAACGSDDSGSMRPAPAACDGIVHVFDREYTHPGPARRTVEESVTAGMVGAAATDELTFVHLPESSSDGRSTFAVMSGQVQRATAVVARTAPGFGLESYTACSTP